MLLDGDSVPVAQSTDLEKDFRDARRLDTASKDVLVGGDPVGLCDDA